MSILTNVRLVTMTVTKMQIVKILMEATSVHALMVSWVTTLAASMSTNVQMAQPNVEKMQDASTQEVIANVSVFWDIKVTVSHAERKMHVPTEVITVTLKPIVLAQRITKGKISITCICKEGVLTPVKVS